jgi:uncharacterized membrane protein
MGTISDSSVIAPPGTRLAPRQNLEGSERLWTTAAGAAVGVAVLSGALVVRGTTGVAPFTRSFGAGPDDKAAAKEAGWSQATVTSRAVTINAPRNVVYDYFRNFSNLPNFMTNIESITETDPAHSHWTVVGPGGVKVEWDSVARDRRDEMIEWESLPGASVPNKGAVQFRDAAGGRGTEVHATIIYRPPGGTIGKLVAKLMQREPGIQARRDLKRLKMILECGEIATNAPQGATPKS